MGKGLSLGKKLKKFQFRESSINQTQSYLLGSILLKTIYGKKRVQEKDIPFRNYIFYFGGINGSSSIREDFRELVRLKRLKREYSRLGLEHD